MLENKVSIREIIGENISLSKFAKSLNISRPTLYKYMDAYDVGNVECIPDSVLKTFDRVSSEKSKKSLHIYFNEMYENYVRTKERRMRNNPVPPDIAEIVDNENLSVKDIDLMIEKAKKHKKRLLEREFVDEDEVNSVTKDIHDLEYTREMVEKRRCENRFILIRYDLWTACIGSTESDTVDFDEETEMEMPGLETKFRFYMAKAQCGYTLFFYNDSEGDNVELQLLTGPREDYTENIMGVFYPEPGMKFIRIPDLFDEDTGDFFRFRIIRSRDGIILNTAIGKFTF